MPPKLGCRGKFCFLRNLKCRKLHGKLLWPVVFPHYLCRLLHSPMTIKEHFRRHVVLAYPVVIGQLGHIMVVVADTVMVGRIGVVPLAAATFASTFLNLLMLFGIGTSYAITPLVAATDSADRKTLMGFFRNGLLLNAVLGTGLVLVALAVWPFLPFFGQEPEVARQAGPYLVIVAGSLVPLMIFQTCRQFLEGRSDTFRPMMVSIMANVLNIALNYVMIYGKLGFPALGLNGAGYATLISRVIMALVMWLVMRRLMLGMGWQFHWPTIRRLLHLGVPSGMQYVFEVGAFAMAAIMVGWISAEALAAHQIALNLAAITYMVAIGISSAATIRIGNQMGQKDLTNLRVAGYTALAMGAFFMGVCGILFVLFRYQLTALYISDPQVQRVAAGLLIIAAAFQISDGLQAVGLGILRGLTDVKVPTLVTFFAYWLVAIPGGYLLGFTFGMGPKGIWYALLVGLSIAAVLHFIRFRGLTNRIRF